MSNTSRKKVLLWTPRILTILYASFLVLFAFDVFGEEASFTEKLLGFIIHSTPALAVIIFLLVAWQYRLAGGILFVVFGIVFTVYFSTYESLPRFAIVSLPVFIIGMLFILSNFTRKALDPISEQKEG